MKSNSHLISSKLVSTLNITQHQCQYTGNNILKCQYVSIICKHLISQDSNESTLIRDQQPTQLLNEFHHLLQYHDDKDSFL